MVLMTINSTHQRLLFIDVMSYWRGEIRNKDIQRQFSVSRQQAYKDIQQFIQHHPNALIKQPSGAYRRTFAGANSHAKPSLEGYLNWFLSGQFNPPPCQESQPLACEVLLPSRAVSQRVIAALCNAMEQQKRVELGYVSLSHPEWDGRIFHPHTFVKTAQRWHVRGYCEKSQGFRDLVLSRCRGEAEVLDASPISRESDTAWTTYIEMILAPDPRLSQAQKEVLAHDYAMENGQLTIRSRAALADYLLKELQVNTKYLDGTPEAQQLILVNRNDIKQWLFSE